MSIEPIGKVTGFAESEKLSFASAKARAYRFSLDLSRLCAYEYAQPQ